MLGGMLSSLASPTVGIYSDQIWLHCCLPLFFVPEVVRMQCCQWFPIDPMLLSDMLVDLF